MKNLRPTFLHNGGKFILAKKIVEHMPQHDIYVEPFCGAASVFFRKEPSKVEILNDIDSEIINVFRVLKHPKLAKKLKKWCELTPYSKEEHDGFHNTAWIMDPVERAGAFIARSFMGRGRSNEKTGFRISLKANRNPALYWKNYPQAINVFTERLRDASIEKMDAIKCIEKYDTRDTLFYIDPPYEFNTRRGGKRVLYKHEVDDDFHMRLIDVLSSIKGMAIVSSYPMSIYSKLGREGITLASKDCMNRSTKEILWIKDAS